MKRKAIVIGASGRVGQALVHELSALYETVIVITRTQPRLMSENMHIYSVKDFGVLADTVQAIAIGNDTDAFSCLGLTKANAASLDEFRQVNVGYNVAFAKACKDKGVQRFFYLSKKGADKSTRHDDIAIKSVVENELKRLGFDNLYLFRLSQLTLDKIGFSIKNISDTSINIVKNVLRLALRVQHQPLTPRHVAVAISLIAYQSHTQKHKKAVQIITHERMVAMTENLSQ
ncbi:NAD(P)H-binding protein [Moraxella nasovis]|uniref:NAD-dependent epimerase/dehydratase family protein n=1 Tax=Moraxella nasovis TaxID=2904121 RepID=UPI001F609337|nr:NAD-dependent epimerase/dehydratase family protein [Moraxella nasovis]UNU73404.1 NAD(P)H-binding protein [Moraxella nasovis]